MVMTSPTRRRRRPSILTDAFNLERLITECDAALAVDPDNLRALTARGHAYVKAKRWAQAVQDLSVVLEARPDDEHARFSRGMALFQSAQVDAARQDFSLVLAHNPAHVMARYARAGCYSSEGEYGQAIQEYWLALRHDEESDRSGWSGGGGAAAMAAETTTRDVGNGGAQVSRTTGGIEPAMVASTASKCSETAVSEPKRAARKVVQVRVNLTQFAVTAGPSSRPEAAAATTKAGIETTESGVMATKGQRGGDLAEAGANQQAAVEDREAVVKARAAPRVVRRVTVAL